MPKKYKLIIFSFCFLSLGLAADFSLAANGNWELPGIQYPSIPFSNAETPNQFIAKINTGTYPAEKALPLYIQYFYHLFLYFAGFLIFGTLIFGGFQYLIAAGSPGRILEAKQWISGSVTGIIILLSSYVILTTINPQLTILSLTSRTPVELPPIDISPLPSPENPVYFQVPMGKIIENAILNAEGREKMTLTKNTAEIARQTAERLKDLTEELKNLTDACRCGSSQCSGTCAGTGCTGTCDQEAISQKITEINSAITALKENQIQIVAARESIITDFLALKKAGILTSLADGVIDYNTSLILKFYQQIDIDSFSDWPNNKITVNGQSTDDPLTFYFDKAGNEDTIRNASALTYRDSPFPADAGIVLPPYQPPQTPPSNLVDTAKAVSERTGVRAAFLLGLTYHESSWSINPGVPYLANKDRVCYCKFDSKWSVTVCNTLESIVREIGLDINTINVSAPSAEAGCGGAMGIAQIMPFTWLDVRHRVSSLTGNSPSSPYRMFDGFAGEALVLLDKYNYGRETNLTSCETEKRLVLRYFGCNPNDLSECPSPLYGERVVQTSEDIARRENLEHCAP